MCGTPRIVLDHVVLRLIHVEEFFFSGFFFVRKRIDRIIWNLVWINKFVELKWEKKEEMETIWFSFFHSFSLSVTCTIRCLNFFFYVSISHSTSWSWFRSRHFTHSMKEEKEEGEKRTNQRMYFNGGRNVSDIHTTRHTFNVLLVHSTALHNQFVLSLFFFSFFVVPSNFSFLVFSWTLNWFSLIEWMHRHKTRIQKK